MFDLFKKKSKGPDFSEVDSLEKAVAMFERGDLERLWLLPEEFGGEDVPPNIVYVPVGVAAIKARTDRNTVMPLAEQGKITRYSATPQYADKSFIPTAIQISATDPGDFTLTLNIWGDGVRS